MTSPSEQTILVTGANGFLGLHVLEVFLNAGYKVLATVRSESSASSIKASRLPHRENLSFVTVPDMTVPGAFDDALTSVSGVIHVASPFTLAPEDNRRDVLDPAINITLNVLNSAYIHGKSVKRVVVTSSFAAIVDLTKGYRPNYTYTEKDWNPTTYELAAEMKDGAEAYCASKTLAERAAWTWMEEHKPSFSLSTINPPWVFGPPQSPIKSLSTLGESLDVIYKLVNGSLTSIPPADFCASSDVRDVAKAHLLAFEKEEAGGERFFVTSGHFDYHLACEILRKRFPELEKQGRIPKDGESNVETYGVDGSKAARILGLVYRDQDTTLGDTVEALLDVMRRGGSSES